MKLDMTSSQPALRQLELSDKDVLCTKDKTLRHHPGNCFFRAHIDKMLPTYKSVTSKLNKMNLTKQIVDELEMFHGMRFVKFNDETASWEQVDSSVAREKVGHAIRFAIRREQKQALKKETTKTALKARTVYKVRSTMEACHVVSDYSSSDEESTGVLDQQDQETMQPTASSVSPDYTRSSLDNIMSSVNISHDCIMGSEMTPMSQSESTSLVWTQEDFQFLMNETVLFQE